MPNSYGNTVGYLALKLKADNASRQQALADQKTVLNDSGAEHDVGGKALAVVQGEVTNQRARAAAQAKAEADLNRALQVQDLSNQGALSRQNVRRSAEDPATASLILRRQNQNENDQTRLAQTQNRDAFHRNVEHPDLMNFRAAQLDQGDARIKAGYGKAVNPITGGLLFRTQLPDGVIQAPGPGPGKAIVTKNERQKMGEQFDETEKALRGYDEAYNALAAVPKQYWGVKAGGLGDKVPVLGRFGMNDVRDVTASAGSDPRSKKEAAGRAEGERQFQDLINKMNKAINSSRATDQDRANVAKALGAIRSSTSVYGNEQDQILHAIDVMRAFERADQAKRGKALETGVRDVSGQAPNAREALFQEKLKELGDPDAAYDAVNEELGEEDDEP